MRLELNFTFQELNNFNDFNLFMIKSNKNKRRSKTFEKSQLLTTKNGSTNPAKSKVELFEIVINDVFVSRSSLKKASLK